MKFYILLLRPKDWAKNLFLFLPSFFAGDIFSKYIIIRLVIGFISFCCFASSIYIVNDYNDIESDRKHPVKSKRPLASGKVKKSHAMVVCVLLIILGSFLAHFADHSFLFFFLLTIYFLINIFYSFGLKNIAILDIVLVSAGFVLRVKSGAVIAQVGTSEWIIIMTFLLSLFMAIGKRRDDLRLKQNTDIDMRKSISGYNLDFLNTMLGLFGAIIIVSYINYSVSSSTVARLGTYRLYYSSLFVITGVMRYLQIILVQKKSGSPTEILFKDRFIQLTILLWVASIYTILYLRDVKIFT